MPLEPADEFWSLSEVFTSGIKRRARRALERQLDYQRQKARRLVGQEEAVMASMASHSAAVREKLNAVQPIPYDARVIEVGSGAHGLIFFFDASERIGVDPLADHYRELFPRWQSLVPTIAAFGEELPFPDNSFDVVLSDNVVDHAENPRQIVKELARVLKPGGLLYFTVNVHHAFYHAAATVHAGWRALGLPLEVAPFADHTVHLTLGAARHLFADLPLEVMSESNTIERTRLEGYQGQRRHIGDSLKRFFFKNASWEAIAVKT